MRLYADDLPDRALWCVIHVPSAAVLKRVVWVDDVEHRYCQDVDPLEIDPTTGETRKVERQAKEVRIIMEKRLVLVDPVADGENSSSKVENRCLQGRELDCII